MKVRNCIRVFALTLIIPLSIGCSKLRTVEQASEQSSSSAPPAPVSAPPVPLTPSKPIPELALWESQMVSYGKKHCDNLIAIKDGPLDPPLFATYYDATRVFYQIASYTGQTAYFNTCADTARYIYGDRYAAANNYVTSGYWNFTTGLRLDFERTGRQSSKDAVIGISMNAAFAGDLTPDNYTVNFGLQRETAYAILAFINAEKVGAPKRARRALLVNHAYGHLDQFMDPNQWGTVDVLPFMAGLTAYALIQDWEETHDARLMPKLRQLADFLWTRTWRDAEQGMLYNINPVSGEGLSTHGAPDLNMLIAPLYGFLYQQTGETVFRDQGDALFAGGARFAYLDGPKQFNQNYIYSFEYVTRRSSR